MIPPIGPGGKPLATFRRKIREPKCWGGISAFAIFCKPERI
jgi:hypothetical protein